MIRASVFMIFVVLTMATALISQAEEPVSDLIARGDSAYDKFDNRKAAEWYTLALKKDRQNYDATWKLSRAYVDLGEKLENKKERRRFYKKAEELARQAIELNPEGSKGHLYLSIALGRVALDAGPKERVRLSKEIKKEVDRSLQLDPNDDVAWHVLGRWHRKLATLSWIEKKFANIFLGGVPKEASVEKSAECFQKAIELNPTHINHYLELGITFQALGKKQEAIETFKKVLELPINDADDEEHKEEARKRLEKLT